MITRMTLAAALLGATALSAQAQDLRIGLSNDPDMLDPDQSQTSQGRVVYTALCDKLVDITPDLEIIPQLATDWSFSDDNTALTMQLREGVTFHDGTPFNAEAVARNIERSQTLEESRRKSELSSVEGAEVLGEYEVRLNLSSPDVTVLAQLADRAGMMISPDVAEKAGTDFGSHPVCSGPFKFDRRVVQDRIILTKYDDYWNADEIHLDSVTYLPIPDTTVRLANLQSGDIDILERLAPTDLKQAEADPEIQVEKVTSLGYQGINFNVGNGERSDNPFGNDKRVRQAMNLAIDRNTLVQVVFNGAFTAGNQQMSPTSRWYDNDHPVPERDVEKARKLLAKAGYPDGVDLEVQTPNTPVQLQMMQVVQSMAAEAGIRVSIAAKEFATLLHDQSVGDYQASQVGWSGRVDPDGNLHQFVTTNGGINAPKYSNAEVDRLMNAARTTTDYADRKSFYDQARDILAEDLPRISLYHPTWIWALDKSVEGFVPYVDGMIRLEGVTLNKD